MSTNNKPLVVTVIVHFNTPIECLQLINDLQTITWPNHKIVIVDNQSEEGYFEYLKIELEHSNVTLIRNTVNNGYGGGINYGVSQIQNLKADFYQILNTDTRIFNPDYISQLIQGFFVNQGVGLIGPGVKISNGEIQNTVMPFVSIIGILSRNIPKKSFISSSPSFKKIEVINGVCFLISSKAFIKIGGFDQDFFMYGEEHDLCYRLKKNGFDSYFWSGPSIIHLNEIQTQSEKKITWRDTLIMSNQVLLLKKHNSFVSAMFISFIFSISIIIKYFSGVKFPDTPLLVTIQGLFKPEKMNNYIKNR